MGASLTSPLPHRPPTSVCNHLFTASDAPPLFRTHPINEPNKRHHSMLAVGWNWSKKAAQQSLNEIRHTPTKKLKLANRNLGEE
ncbi:unnamed protein product [Toxocara canis]|uniref:Uncharacterized protein n=1 Tax=Toxocara canis TaxID=6265 RepID=A0A183UZ01_TOXCA|nr:unnamed protein product [Toxocara canis]